MMGLAKEIPIPQRLGSSASILLRQGWLSERSNRFQQDLLDKARQREFAAGQSIYLASDEPEGLFGLVSGLLQISVPTDSGTDLVVHRTDPGFWIGDLAVFSDEARLVSVEAVTDALTVYIPRSSLCEIVEKTPEAYKDFYALTHKNMDTALRLLANMTTQFSDKRLAMRLLHQDDQSGQIGAWLEIPQEQLAHLIAVSVPTLQRILKRFVAEGLVESGYGKLRIRDRAGLKRYCET